MNESTDRARDCGIRRDAALAGVGGVLGGWAIFVLLVDNLDQLWILALAILVASCTAVVLEHLYGVIREGRGDLERHSLFPDGVAVVLLVVICGLFGTASSRVVELSTSEELLQNLLPSLLGITDVGSSYSMPSWWLLTGLVTIWCYQGMAASQWLVGMLQSSSLNDSADDRRLLKQMAVLAVKGFFGAAYCVAALLVALLAFRLFAILSDAAVLEAIEHQFHAVPRVEVLFGLFRLWHAVMGWLGSFLRLDGVVTMWRAVPAILVVLLFLRFGNRLLEHLRRGRMRQFTQQFFAGLKGEYILQLMLAGAFLALVGPIVFIGPIATLKLMVVTAIVWVIPAAVLGGLIPLMQRLSRLPGFWLGGVLLWAALSFVAIWLRQERVWYWLALALTFLVVGVAAIVRRNGLHTERAHAWPLFPLVVALLMFAPVMLRQGISYEFLHGTHTVMSVAPPAPSIGIPVVKDGKVFDFNSLSWRPIRVTDLEQATKDANEAMVRFQHAWQKEMLAVERFVGHDDLHAEKHENDKKCHPPLLESVTSVLHVVSEMRLKHARLAELRAVFNDEGNRQAITSLIERERRFDRLDRERRDSNMPLRTLSERVLPSSATGNEVAREERLVLHDQAEAERRVDASIDAADTVLNRFEAKTTRGNINRASQKLNEASIKLAQILELSVSASFGFWVTLSCLAAWSRLRPANSHA